MAFKIGKNCKIHPTAVIDVKEGFLGEGAFIRENARIEGTRVEIGRECFMDRGASIGGGSCFDPGAFIQAGDWLHMGVNSHINIGRGVAIGHEFGCGIETKIFTHGAYTDSYSIGAPVQWAPVRIGDHVWMPNAWVNPGCEIGDHVVVAARSLVNRSLPAGCLAGGIPVKILRENYLPRRLNPEERSQLAEQITESARARLEQSGIARESVRIHWESDGRVHFECPDGETSFDLLKKTIHGSANPSSELLKDQLRRNGIRFRYEKVQGRWVPW